MKIVEITPSRLVIEDRPWFLWILIPVLAGPALFAALTGQVDGTWQTLLVGATGVTFFWVMHHFAPFQRFIFDRDAALFTHAIRRINGGRSWTLPLGDIRRAADQGSWSDGTRLERVILLTKNGRHPLESGYSSRRAKPMIDAINSWLDGEETTEAP